VIQWLAVGEVESGPPRKRRNTIRCTATGRPAEIENYCFCHKKLISKDFNSVNGIDIGYNWYTDTAIQ